MPPKKKGVIKPSKKPPDPSSKTAEDERIYTTEKPPDEYKCIKVSLKKILKRQEDLAIIEDAVNRTHRITIKTYQLMKLHILNEYHAKKDIPTIDENFVFLIQQAIINPKGKRLTDKKDLVKKLSELYPFGFEDGTHLKQVLDYIRTEIVTAVENNIKENYLKYLKKFVNSFFHNKYEKEMKNKTFKANLLKDIKAIQKDIIENTSNCDSKYHSWLNEYRSLIIPTFEDNKGFYYDIKAHCQKYLKHMIWINLQLEDLGVKLFQPIPLRTDLVPKSIKLCSTTLKWLYQSVQEAIENSKPKRINWIAKYGMVERGSEMVTELISRTRINYPKESEDIEKEKPIIWGHLFDIKQTLKGYSFDYSIVTDGYSASLVFIEKGKKVKVDQKKANNREALMKYNGLPREEKAKRRKADKDEKDRIWKEKKVNPPVSKEKDPTYTDFLYFNEVDKSELEGKKVFVDPGKKSIYTMMDENKNFLSYTTAQHTHNTKRFKYQKILEQYKEKRGISKIEEKLSEACSKTCYIENFKKYLDVKTEANEKLLPMYADEFFRRYSWYSFINTKRAEDKMLDLIEKKFCKDAIIILGDASLGHHMRGLVSTPNIKLNRKLKTRFKVFLIDEFRTSCLPCHTSEKEVKCENFTYEDKKVKPNLRKELKELLKKKEAERTEVEKKRIDNIFKFLRKYKDTVKLRKLHSVLTYKMENGRLGCINRDRNACLNMMKIFKHQMETGARPQEFTRGYELNKMETTLAERLVSNAPNKKHTGPIK